MEPSSPEYNTWFDQKPSHPMPPAFVREAQKRLEIAMKEYDDYIDHIFSGHCFDKIDRETLERLADATIKAENDLLACKREWHASLDEADQRDTLESVRP